MICPHCRTDTGCSWWHQCPKYNQPVCRSCHDSCEYNLDSHNGPGCSYSRHHPATDNREELAKLNNQIRAKIKKQQFYYHRGWMKGGHDIGLEIARLKKQKYELEERR